MSDFAQVDTNLQNDSTDHLDTIDQPSQLPDGESRPTEVMNDIDQSKSDTSPAILEPPRAPAELDQNSQTIGSTSTIARSSIDSIVSPRRFALWDHKLLAPHVFIEMRQRSQLDLREIQKIAQKDFTAAYRKIRDVSNSVFAQNNQLETAYAQLYAGALKGETKFRELREHHTTVKRELFQARKDLKDALDRTRVESDIDEDFEKERTRLQETIDGYETKVEDLEAENVRHLATKWRDDQEIKLLLDQNQQLKSLLVEQKQAVDRYENTIFQLEREISQTADYLETGMEMTHGLMDRLKDHTIETVRMRLGLGATQQPESLGTSQTSSQPVAESLEHIKELLMHEEGNATKSGSTDQSRTSQGTAQSIQAPDSGVVLHQTPGSVHYGPVESPATSNPLVAASKAMESSDAGIEGNDISDVQNTEQIMHAGRSNTSSQSGQSLTRRTIQDNLPGRAYYTLADSMSVTDTDSAHSHLMQLDTGIAHTTPYAHSTKATHDNQQTKSSNNDAAYTGYIDAGNFDSDNTDGAETWENFTISSYISSSQDASDNNISSSEDDKASSAQDSDYDENSDTKSQPTSIRKEYTSNIQDSVTEHALKPNFLGATAAGPEPFVDATQRSTASQDLPRKLIPASVPFDIDQMALDIESALEARSTRYSSSTSLSTADTDAELEVQLDRAIASQQATGRIHLSSKFVRNAQMPKINSTLRNALTNSRDIRPLIPPPIPEVDGSVPRDNVLGDVSRATNMPTSANSRYNALDSARPVFRAVSYTSSSTQSSQNVEDKSLSSSPISPFSMPKPKQPQQSQRDPNPASNSGADDVHVEGVVQVQDSEQLRSTADSNGGGNSNSRNHAASNSIGTARDLAPNADNRQRISIAVGPDEPARPPRPDEMTWKQWFKSIILRLASWFRRIMAVLYPSTLLSLLNKLRASVSDYLDLNAITELTFALPTLSLTGIISTVVDATKSVKHSFLWNAVHIIAISCTLYLAHSLYRARQFWYTANTSSARTQVLSWREDRWEWTPLVFLQWYAELYISSLYKGHNLLLV